MSVTLLEKGHDHQVICVASWLLHWGVGGLLLERSCTDPLFGGAHHPELWPSHASDAKEGQVPSRICTVSGCSKELVLLVAFLFPMVFLKQILKQK